MIAIFGDEMVSHLQVALVAHSKMLKRNGLAEPPALKEFFEQLAARSGQERPIFAPVAEESHDDDVRLLGVEDVARRLNLSPRTVRRFIASGQLRSCKLGGCRRVHVDDVEAFAKGGAQ